MSVRWLRACFLVASLAGIGCRVSAHPTEATEARPAALSLPESLAAPGPIEFETVVAADWSVDREGLINLENPKAKAAGIQKGPEPIQIYFYALRHPTQGLFLVDTGVEAAVRDNPDDVAVGGLVSSVMKLESMKVKNDTAGWLRAQSSPVAGIFLTHGHVDHVMGLPDIPKDVPVYTGPGEFSERAAVNSLLRRTYRHYLGGRPALREWSFARDASGSFEGLRDIFGDGSVWAISVPGHTPGSTAYLVRTTRGPVLLVGDTCHTAWGWENGVEPGSFTSNHEENAKNLERLRRLVAAHPEIEVHLGHQSLPGAPASTSAPAALR